MVVGQNADAQQYKRIKKALFTCLGCTFTVTLAITLLVSVLGVSLLSIYISDSPEAIAYVLQRIAMVGTLYALYALMDTAAGSLRGMGVSLMPMLISLIGVCGLRILWVNMLFQIPEYHTPSICIYVSRFRG